MTSGALSSPLYENNQVTLDVNGNGQCGVTPYGTRNGGLTWDVTAVSVLVSDDTIEAQASAYLSYGIQDTDPQDFLGQTATGSSGDTCGIGQTIRPGDWITVVWSGGVPGAIATMRITGTVNPPGSSA
jgi:hypothetical protein